METIKVQKNQIIAKQKEKVKALENQNKALQEEIKQKLQVVAKLHEVAFDISVAIGTFARGTLAVESDLQEAKTSAKKLIEKIDEYLESQEPEFKYGDIVASRIFRDASFSLVRPTISKS